MCLLMVYALSSWLPKLMLAAGYSLGKSILFLLALNVGAMIGSIGGGILSDKFHLKPVIMGNATGGCCCFSRFRFLSHQPMFYMVW